VVKFLGVNGFRWSPYNGDWNNYGPRFGFAWKPFSSQKTVVRGGYGIFYAHPFDRTQANTATLGFETSSNMVVPDNNLTVPYTLGGGLPVPPTIRPPLNDSFGAVAAGQTATQAVTFFETNRRTGYSQQMNLRIQREIFGGTLVEAGYVGNLSRKLSNANITLNQIRPELMGPGTGQKDRPYPQFSNVQILAPSFGISSYHAGVAKVEKRFSRGFNILSTYTWAKFLDNADTGAASLGNEGNAYSNIYNRRADWGPSENDIRHRLTWSSVYQLPFGKGRSYMKEHWAGRVVGGWSLGSVLLLQSGAPITVNTQTNTTYSNSPTLRADVLRNPNLPGDQRSIYRWFDTSAFVQPAPYVFGNEGVGLVRADGAFNINCSAIRTFKIREKMQMQFRGELFNVLNHPTFGNPGNTFEGSGFGIVSSARPARQVQLGLRLTY
jgi:hypothetical protein